MNEPLSLGLMDEESAANSSLYAPYLAGLKIIPYMDWGQRRQLYHMALEGDNYTIIKL